MIPPWIPDQDNMIGIHPRDFSSTQKLVEKRQITINVQRSYKGNNYPTNDRLKELTIRPQGDFERKKPLAADPNNKAAGFIHNFAPDHHDPQGTTEYQGNPSRFQLTRTEQDLNKYFTYISLEVGTMCLQIPTSDRWGMTTDQRGGHITVAYLADMDDQQLRDLNNNLQ